MPYREMVPRIVAQPDDPAAVVLAFSLRERFGRADSSKLWPAPTRLPFEELSPTVVTTSADGSRLLVCYRSVAWLLDTKTMTATEALSLPAPPRRAALNRDGSVAALVSGEELYRWPLGDQPDPNSMVSIGRSSGLSTIDVIRLSADAQVAVTSSYRGRARVRTLDMSSGALTHSFEADSDECFLLHPSGRHLFVFGDDGTGRVYGRDGLEQEIQETGGGVLSLDGTELVVGSHRHQNTFHRFSVETSGDRIELCEVAKVAIPFNVARWDMFGCYAADGRRALIKSDKGQAWLVDVRSGRAQNMNFEIDRESAVVAEHWVVSPELSTGLAAHQNAIGLVEVSSGQLTGAITIAKGNPPRLVGVATGGLYGGLEIAAAPLRDAPELPYERTASGDGVGIGMSTVLRTKNSTRASVLGSPDQLRWGEVNERQRAWARHLGILTTDITQVELSELNRGLVELTPELVARALAKNSQAAVPRFGEVQAGLRALQAAASELRALGPAAREEAFATMIERMRRGKSNRNAASGDDITQHQPSTALLPPAGDTLEPSLFSRPIAPPPAPPSSRAALVVAKPATLSRTGGVAIATGTALLIVLAALLVMLAG